MPRKPGTGNADATTLVFSGERRRERALAGPVLAARSAQRVGFRRAFARRSAAVSHRTLGHIGGALRTHHKSERDDVYRIHNGHKEWTTLNGKLHTNLNRGESDVASSSILQKYDP